MGIMTSGQWAIGKTCLFMRTAQSAVLELARQNKLNAIAVILQKYARKFIVHSRFCRYRGIMHAIAAAISAREESMLIEVVNNATILPWRGSHVAIVKKANSLLLRAKDEKNIDQLLTTAIDSFEMNIIRSAIAAHAALQPIFATPLLAEAKAVLAKLEKEAEITNALVQATAARSLESLLIAIQQAEKIQLVCEELNQAVLLKVIIEREHELLANIKSAIISKDWVLLTTFISECRDLGFTGPEVRVAEQLALSAAEEAAAIRAKLLEDTKNNLIEAMESKNVTNINAAIVQAVDHGLPAAEIAEARSLVDSLIKIEVIRNQLSESLNDLQIKRKTSIYERDLEILAKAIKNAEMVNLFTSKLPNS